MTDLAPIILFVYNRPIHTKNTIECLKKNDLANLSELIIYSDMYKNLKDKKNVIKVRKLIKSISGFKKVTVIERRENYGLAKNIINGVTEVLDTNSSAVILEDDIETGKYFLKFMNEALNRYINDSNVWHISGWNYPINTKNIKEDYKDAFLWKVMNCWGWATWSNKWSKFKKNPTELISNWNKDKIKKFNLDGNYNFWEQVENNFKGISNTWAIFWMITIFENNGYCMNPVKSYVYNSGNDNSGENTNKTKNYNSIINDKMIKSWPSIDDDFKNIISVLIKDNFKKNNLIINMFNFIKNKLY